LEYRNDLRVLGVTSREKVVVSIAFLRKEKVNWTNVYQYAYIISETTRTA